MKPILFNTEMVKAILDGRKTQTRRVVNLKNNDLIFTGFVMSSTAKNREGCCAFGKSKECDLEFIKPKYKVGDVLYVRETFVLEGMTYDENGELIHHEEPIVHYKADEKKLNWIDEWENECNIPWKPSIHMPKKYARIFLKVTNVRVERLQDISDEDCIKEGIVEVTKDNQVFKFCIYDKKDYSSTPWQDMPRNPQEVYKKLWNSTSKDGYKWEDNPYVFVYEFERVYDV